MGNPVTLRKWSAHGHFPHLHYFTGGHVFSGFVWRWFYLIINYINIIYLYHICEGHTDSRKHPQHGCHFPSEILRFAIPPHDRVFCLETFQQLICWNNPKSAKFYCAARPKQSPFGGPFQAVRLLQPSKPVHASAKRFVAAVHAAQLVPQIDWRKLRWRICVHLWYIQAFVCGSYLLRFAPSLLVCVSLFIGGLVLWIILASNMMSMVVGPAKVRYKWWLCNLVVVHELKTGMLDILCIYIYKASTNRW